MNYPILPNPTAAGPRLSIRQKWQLALTLFVISYPILRYMFTEGSSWNVPDLLLWTLLHAVTMLPFYFIWVAVAEWLQVRLAGWLGEDSLLEMRPVAQLVLFGFSLLLAVGFLAAWTRVLQQAQTVLLTWRGQPTSFTYSPEYARLFDRANNGFFLLLMLLVFYLLANRQALLRVRGAQERARQQEQAALQAQLGALKSQVNPHFLFNSLNILSSLVHQDAHLAEQFIEHLARAYRYTLEQRAHELVPLGTELEFIDTYAFLLRLRFADKFSLQVEVPAVAQQAYCLAPLTLQLLVENAVKHNQMSRAQPLRIRIRQVGEELLVSNTLRRRRATHAVGSTGLGLANIYARYALLTSRSVGVRETEDEFTVTIPLLT